MVNRGTRTLVLGGVRSGKSAYGESLLAPHRRVRYIATGPTTSTDAEWVARVAEHRRRRDARYTTIETIEVAEALRAEADEASLVDDLGNWLAATLDAHGAWDDPGVDLADARSALAAAVGDHRGDLVLISPEVGLAPVAPTPAGRRFQDDLGALNTAIAAVCDRVVLVVAGRVLELPGVASGVGLPAAVAPAPVASTTVASAPTTPDTIPADEGSASGPTASAVTDTAAGDLSDRPGVAGTPAAGLAPRPIDPTDAEVFATPTPPDPSVARAARERHADLTKPPGSLGRLEELGIWISACQGVCPPQQIENPAVVVFAGDHGVAAGGVSAYPPEVTGQMVATIASGTAAVNILARRSGATVRVVDMSVDAETAPEISGYKVRRSSGDLRVTDALTLAEARSALAAGRAIADDLVDSGADLLIAGEMGIGNTTPATVLIGALTRREPVEVIGRGTGIDDAGWIRKTAAIRDGMHRVRPILHDPLALLAAVAGADLTAMAGFLAQAAIRRTPVILDGVVVTAAAMVANELAPGATTWWVAGHRSTEPAHQIALDHLDLEPILDLSLRLGEGSGALLALPAVGAAVDILSSMSTFAEAGVTDSGSQPVPAT
ncbi:nicotinate-nucleotide--dimethylbenzimidazole phosphoribosyltransferase [Gordonia soli]|uniref:Nicotinate-nucleotide--dimethylbenzimidazole phosphoribosyltransferase n=1 Tax=Gordonia soli NBRC 108243 TaxID=1223545 RepID=M0QM62_9ACTN|nr:nicotinate-nucleotide--dimethylbenzimidazole phosphoribosyltransferase [Gordonia soli]GAC69504.1 nicotinate-nucleotide--dimethylbenzimidazole phosphoribosyltransferase [Gordonia soli NBRC 108243]